MADDPIHQTKTCTKCEEAKPLQEFHRHPMGKYQRASRCRACIAAYDAEKWRRRRKENAEHIRELRRAWRKANPDKLKALKRADYFKRSEAVKKKAREWWDNNREKRRDTQKKWRDRNRERVRQSQRRAEKKWLSTPKGRLEKSVRANVCNALKAGAKGGRRTFALLGYTAEELMQHLERQFLPGMTWGNYGRNGWHIDHIIPVSAHNYDSPDDPDFKRAWAFSNIRPLWASDNHKKSNKLSGPFQPSLQL